MPPRKAGVVSGENAAFVTDVVGAALASMKVMRTEAMIKAAAMAVSFVSVERTMPCPFVPVGGLRPPGCYIDPFPPFGVCMF